VETKNHAIFTELTRVRQYFDKIQKLENPPPAPERETTLNTQAAIRFVRADLVRLCPLWLILSPSMLSDTLAE